MVGVFDGAAVFEPRVDTTTATSRIRDNRGREEPLGPGRQAQWTLLRAGFDM